MGESETRSSEIGRYRVDRQLAQGAMGRVLLAHDPVLDRNVAATMLRPDLDISPEMFPGDDAVIVAARIGTEQPKPMAQSCNLDPRVDHVLGRALNKDSARRFPNCEAFGEALGAALEIGAALDTRSLCNTRGNAVPRRAIGLWASVGLGGAAVGALIAIVLLSVMKPPAPTPFEIVSARGAWSAPGATTEAPTLDATAPRTPNKPRTTVGKSTTRPDAAALMP